MHYKTTDEALRSRIKSETRGSLMSTPKMTKRYVVERVTDHFADAFGPLPFRLVGGLLNPQWSRETTDADIKCIRRFTELELASGLARMKEILRPEGIDVVHIHPTHMIEIPGIREPVRRIKLDTITGGMVANTNVDIRCDWGPHAWSKHYQEKTFEPLFQNGPTYTATVECKEAEIAAKWIALFTQCETDLRTKHHFDLIYMCATGGFKHERVAQEMHRLQKHLGIPSSTMVRKMQGPLEFKAFKARAQTWEKLLAERHESLCVEEGYMHLNVQWRSLQEHWLTIYRAECMERHLERQTRLSYGLPPAPEPAVHTDNVLAFRR
jgi:hypothetical protein